MVDTIVNVVAKAKSGAIATAPQSAPAPSRGRGVRARGGSGGRADPILKAAPILKWNGAVAGRSEQHESKRAAILAEAARLFDERGYYETSLADIAAALHVTKPTLYYYVKNKEDIVGQIIERAIDAVDACAERARAAGSNGLERLRLFAREYVEMMNTDFGRCLLGLRRVPVAAGTRARTAAGYRRIDAIGRELVSEGIADGSIRDCDVRLTAFALYGAMNWTPNWFHRGEALSPSQAGDAIFNVFAAGLATQSAAGGNIP
jgi:AcrR family transcriptional regulator